ncbi:MAG TPA: right-handed parallel beta-helix repeat-containing protein [Albitalea sp.]|uniref:right-handed parallel beta-helix repeat-containing protein n=1 Tax=Piscinibacter sp. TaxID=1903157 RepID=UPI002ED34F74
MRATGSRRRGAATHPRAGSLWLPLLALAVLAAATAIAAIATTLEVPPRVLAPYLRQRAADHHPLLAATGDWAARVLTDLDRGEWRLPRSAGLHIAAASDAPVVGKVVSVASAEHAIEAIARAHAGDVITFEPGMYRFALGIEAREPGSAQAPITVRAAQPGTVVLEFQMSDGFVVSAPHWTFENLTIRGTCAQHSECEHAFHVVGGGHHFTARRNTLTDFNAHVKVNGQDRRFPDDGLIEDNTLTNSRPRETENPVTPIDLVAASRWTIRGNLITDFAKAQGDRVSYGAFAKGGGSDNRFERNVVLCEVQLRGSPGWRVGLSLGGGGTAVEYCRDKRCITEQDGAVLESNLIASCSDDGIYLNRAATSRIVHNTLLDTAGVSVRFPESSAEAEGNLVDGAIRSRDGALLHERDNLETDVAWLYVGRHPLRGLYHDAGGLDLSWSGTPPRRRVAATAADLCGSTRPATPAYGAFEDFRACTRAH